MKTAHANEPGTGTLLLGPVDQWQEAILQDTHIELKADGLLAEMTLSQSFSNTTQHWLEGTYLFPLPDDASVHGMTIQVGDRMIRGQIMPRETARKTYTEARDAGQLASLVEQQRPNLFTSRIASIAPGDSIRITLNITLPVDYSNGRFQLTLPTTMTPRYTNADTPQPDALLAPQASASLIRGPRLTLSASLTPMDSLDNVYSPSHTLVRETETVRVPASPMDRDLVLSWATAAAESPAGQVFTTRLDGDRYAQLLLIPPGPETRKLDTRSRELILIVDRSGSMAGQSMQAAQAAVQVALDGLTERDSVNVIAFNDRTATLFPAAQSVNDRTRELASRFIQQLHADGGTEIRGALLQSLAMPRPDQTGAAPLRQVVFITDGSVGNEDHILKEVSQRLPGSDQQSTRIFSVGIGTAPNHWFLRKLAEAGRGAAISVTDINDAQHAMTALLESIAQPVLTDLVIQYDQGQGEHYPALLPDLYRDEPLLLSSRLSPDVTSMTLRGRLAGQPWEQQLVLGAARDNIAIARHWARSKIETLTDAERVSATPHRHRDEITALAMQTGLVSQYTSFVATEQKTVRPANAVQQHADVAKLLPAGSQMRAIAMPVGAAGSDTALLLSGSCLALALLLLRLSRSLRGPVVTERDLA